jgi:hypothetical protein
MGNFADTSEGLANQQRILAAEVDDLSTKLGTVLVPGLTAVVSGLNDAVSAASTLADGLGKLAAITGIEVPIKFVFSGGTGGHVTQDILRHVLLGPVSPLALGLAIGKEVADGIRGGVDAAATESGAGRHSAGRAAAIAAGKEAAGAPDAAAAAIARATARANITLEQQIKNAAARIAHIKDLIREDPSNAKLQERLTAELKTQNGLIAQQKSLNESNAAAARRTAQDAHAAAVQAAQDRRQAAREAEQAAAERKRARTKSDQFEALGLTAEGGKRTPGSSALLRRAQSLQNQLKGTTLDGSKTSQQLARIVAVLRKNFKTAGKDVREAILGMLNEIDSALEGGKKGGSGPLTKTTGLNTNKLIADLGLSPEQARALRGRLSGFNSGGRALAGGQSRTTGGGFSGVPVVESRITVNLDGVKVASAVTRSQQRTKRRNPQQKRGQHRR